MFLPPELWDMVADHLSETAPVDLLTCARVCHAWHRRAITRFYRTIAIDATSSSRSSIKCQPPVMTSEAFRRLLDSRSPAVYAIHSLHLNLDGEAHGNDCLTGMAFPSNHQVAHLCLRAPIYWLPSNEQLRLSANFGGVVSLKLEGAKIESTSVFAAAIAQFPLLRRLFFSGTLVNRDVGRTSIHPPSFVHPCELSLGRQRSSTWLDILQWALLDLQRFNGIFLDVSEFETFWTDFLPLHPEICGLVHGVTASYNLQESWHDIDAGLGRLVHLRVLRLSVGSIDPTDEAETAVSDKLVEVAKRQTQISPNLRDLHISRIRVFMDGINPSYSCDSLQRLATGLAKLNPPLRIRMSFTWIWGILGAMESSREDMDPFFDSFVSWCRERFPIVERNKPSGSDPMVRLVVSTTEGIRERWAEERHDI